MAALDALHADLRVGRRSEAARGGPIAAGEWSASLEAEEDAAEAVALGRHWCVIEPAEGDGR